MFFLAILASWRRILIMTTQASNPSAVQRQIKLPLSKAVEIAYKNIRMRLSRSLLVTSGIVLALAFLMSIQTSEALTRGMRDWVGSNPTDSSARKQVHELTILMESK